MMNGDKVDRPGDVGRGMRGDDGLTGSGGDEGDLRGEMEEKGFCAWVVVDGFCS